MMQNPFCVRGRAIVVTGGGRGIGRAVALHLAGQGARVFIGGRSVAPLRETCDMARDDGLAMDHFTVDVADTDDIGRAFQALRAKGIQIDALVNNAGTEDLRPAMDADEALWDRIVDTNLRGAFFCALHAAGGMRAGGAIVNMCSLASAVGIPGAVPYGASKSGLLGVTRGLATEWGPKGIRVNAVGPGYFRTEMTEPFFCDEKWREAMMPRIPLGRFGDPAELGGIVQFLCSDAAAYVNGQILYVDGGFLAAI
ncbi:SDR family NAD(P)-dependent oxidoreductase [Komagataeibacter swingsii]|uniref:2-deoxy-D-gluconate 3-dehydrogenase n=1 Tax=Komagataeibacter swingsii TaxID=215220 RepID=A0A2V4R205_9PROT|nr:SDR family oxidoreductase [Komagataeibacter swingsii]PYD70916.1 2-deoxy-D-gluconate 3-dehydrogenase [Komagataeibacter swingsii]